jgi:hypothetical protein
MDGGDVKITELWARLDETFGAAYAASVADDQVFAQLNERTINQALAGGADARTVWRAVVAAYPDRVPARIR